MNGIQALTEDLSLYIHWPFCLSKCPYCDFNSHVINDIDQFVWREGLLTEMKTLAKNTEDRKLKSVFFGGGTPSLMPLKIVESIINMSKRKKWYCYQVNTNFFSHVPPNFLTNWTICNSNSVIIILKHVRQY